jgi:hypothetical protein
MRPVTAATALIPLLAALSLSACGSTPETGTTTGTPEAGDGKVHPAGNGTHESEAAACDALSKAQDAQNVAMMCTATSRPCPALVQVQVGGTVCLEYDQGSVQGCLDYYAMATTCDALATAIADCVVTSFAGSAPNGCP